MHRHAAQTRLLALALTVLAPLGCASSSAGSRTQAADPAAPAAPTAPASEHPPAPDPADASAWTCFEWNGPSGACSKSKANSGAVTAGDRLCHWVMEYVCRTGDTGPVCEAARRWVCD